MGITIRRSCPAETRMIDSQSSSAASARQTSVLWLDGAEIITRQVGQPAIQYRQRATSTSAVHYDCSIVAVYLILALTTPLTWVSWSVNGWTTVKEAGLGDARALDRLPGDGGRRFADWHNVRRWMSADVASSRIGATSAARLRRLRVMCVRASG